MFNSKGRRSHRIAVTAACAAIASSAGVSVALAGVRYGSPSVTIFSTSDGGGYAMGTLGGVRNSAGTRERLYCAVTRSETTNSRGGLLQTTTVICGARSAANVSVTCISTQEKHGAALNGVSNDSLIEFHYDASGNCTNIWVYESASLERKLP
jgi:hypothetical protein